MTDKVLHIGYNGEENATVITFHGWRLSDPSNTLWLIWNGREEFRIPVIDFQVQVDNYMTKYRETAKCSLEERSDRFIAKSRVFDVKVEPSVFADSDAEVIDTRLELVYIKYNELYQKMVALENDVKPIPNAWESLRTEINATVQDLITKRDSGFFNGKDGDDYVLTEADKTEIADEVAQRVHPYDDTEIKAEVNDVKENLSDLNDNVESLETNKADKSELDSKVGFTDYATDNANGVVRGAPQYGTAMYSFGRIVGAPKNYSQYTTSANELLVAKGTLENVLAERLKEPQFELINTITLSGDVSSLLISADVAGNSLKLKRAIMYIEAKTISTPTTWGTIYGFTDTESSSGTSLSASVNNITSASADMNSRADFDISNGLPIIKSYDGNLNKYAVVMPKERVVVGPIGNHFNKFSISCPLASGTKVTLYGIRA